MKAELALSGIVPSMMSDANQERRFRRLQHPWVTMGEPTPCWALEALGLEASAMTRCAHGHGAPA